MLKSTLSILDVHIPAQTNLSMSYLHGVCYLFGSMVAIKMCGAACMEPLQLKDPLEILVRRWQFQIYTH